MGIFHYSGKLHDVPEVRVPAVEDNGQNISKIYFGDTLMWDLRNKTQIKSSDYMYTANGICFATVNGVKLDEETIINYGYTNHQAYGKQVADWLDIPNGRCYTYAANVPKNGFYFAENISNFLTDYRNEFNLANIKWKDWKTGENSVYSHEEVIEMGKYVTNMAYAFQEIGNRLSGPVYIWQNVTNAAFAYTKAAGLASTSLNLHDVIMDNCFEASKFESNSIDVNATNCRMIGAFTSITASTVNMELTNCMSCYNILYGCNVSGLTFEATNTNVVDAVTESTISSINSIKLTNCNAYGFMSSANTSRINNIELRECNAIYFAYAIKSALEIGSININNCNCYQAFQSESRLTSIDEVRMSGNCVTYEMFDACTNLAHIGNCYMPLSTNVSYMFYSCSKMGGNIYFPNTSKTGWTKVIASDIFYGRNRKSPRINIYLPMDNKNCLYWKNLSSDYFDGENYSSAINAYVYEYNTYFAD